MSSAKLTLVGMNSYFQNAGSDLFEFLDLPEGLTKKTLTDNILLQGGEFEVLYSDPVAFKSYIGIWSQREAPTFKRWVDALAIEYAPLENYDKHEDWTDTLDSDGTSRTTGTNDTETSGSVTTDVSAYDSSGYQPKEKVTTSETVDNDTTENNTSTLDNTGHHAGRIHGNIGVTTSQQMLESEFKVRQYDFYKMMYNDIDSILCLSVY